MFRKDLLSVAKAPDDLKTMTVRFKDTAKGTIKMSDFWRKEEAPLPQIDPTDSLLTWLSETMPDKTRMCLDDMVKIESTFEYAFKLEAKTKRSLSAKNDQGKW